MPWRWPAKDRAEELRGGVLLECRFFGFSQAIGRLWCIDALTLAERVVFVARGEAMPKVGDDCWWWDGEDVVWAERGSVWGGRMLQRIGRCFDPEAEDLPLRDRMDG